MIVGIGTDIVALSRIEQAMKRSDRFVKKVLAPQEEVLFEGLSHPQRRLEFVAGRFAAKEAFAKAMGTGIARGLTFSDMVVFNDEAGKPILLCEQFDGRIFLSISHEEAFAVAMVVLEAD